jgi:hypothetical protein
MRQHDRFWVNVMKRESKQNKHTYPFQLLLDKLSRPRHFPQSVSFSIRSTMSALSHLYKISHEVLFSKWSLLYLKNAPLTTAFSPPVKTTWIFTCPEMFQIR